jgi:hypothetical protein
MWIRSRGGESPQISAQKAPQKRKRKKRAKKRLALSVNDEDRKRERECVCVSRLELHFRQNFRCGTDLVSSLKRREGERDPRVHKKREKKRKKKQKYVAL